MLTHVCLALSCLFTPPSDWEITDPKTPSKRALVGFLDKKGSGFRPSCHLTHERVLIPTEDYLKIVQKNCATKKQTWKGLGTLETRSGPAHLAQIEMETKFGPVRLLQAILLQGQDGFILTVSATKRDFLSHSSQFQEILSSMELCEDLHTLIQDPQERETFRRAWQKRSSDVESFKKTVLKHKELGPVWQVLVSR